MSKITKADLLKEIEDLNKRLTEVNEVNMKLVNEKAAMADKADEEFENSSTYKQMTKEIDMLKLQLKTTDGIKESYKNRYSEKDKIMQEILKEIEEYRDMVRKLKEQLEKNNGVHKIKNERGAGRKERFTDKQKVEIKDYRAQGKSIREIAEVYKCSTGLIHKLIND